MTYCLPASQFCCGCTVGFGTKLILGMNLLRCLFYITFAVDSVMNAPSEQLFSIFVGKDLGEKVFLAGWGLMGSTLILFALWGVYNKHEVPIRICWIFLVLSFVVDASLTIYENVINAHCSSLPEAVSAAGTKSLACGIMRALDLFLFVMVANFDLYCLYVVNSFCQDLTMCNGGMTFADLASDASKAAILQKHEDPFLHMYGASRTAASLFLGEAISSGVPDSHQIYGTYHEMQFPPAGAYKTGRL
ncbi:unnamed protein product [Polarella glacialis]|uniref:Uncharacterized protein n=1 Tax=Polarella glacialis TaxID=89957 RepID=A0A813H466_POLGL|nr:unnamed protein product [Polarella glacialis]